MKYIMFYAAFMCCLLSTYITGVENKRPHCLNYPCLNFTVDQHYVITGCLAQQMNFAVSPQEFMGKNMLDVIDLNGSDKENVAQAFMQAVEKHETTQAAYMLDNKKFVAYITPLLNQNSELTSFFIKVREQAVN